MIYDSLKYMEDLKEICNEPLPYETLKDSSVMVTGANGLIGSVIVDSLMMLNELYNFHIRVLAVCRNRDKAEKRFDYYKCRNNFEILIQDINESICFSEKCDYIIHAASNAHPLAYANEPVETMKSNILGTIHLLEYAKKRKIRRFLFVSSSEVYGNGDNKEGYSEEKMGYIDSMKVRSCYSESKRAGETLCVSYGKEYGVDTAVVRLGYIYGAALNDTNSRADAQFVRKAAAKEDIVMKSDGLQYRAYCYITDAVAGIFYVLLLGERDNAYNISNEKSNATIREFAEILASLAGVNIIYENPNDTEKSGYSKVGRAILNSHKLQELGWKPRVLLQEGLERILKILEVKEL